MLFFFFFNDTATTEIYTLSLPTLFRSVVPVEVVLEDIDQQVAAGAAHITFGDPDFFNGPTHARRIVEQLHQDRKSTRLNSSHSQISYAVFCLKKKNNTNVILPYIKDTQ